jgi:dihydroorotate dehydrogenase
LKSFELVYPVADYVAINVSSPNTAGLRELQKSDQFDELLRALQKRNKELSEPSQGRGVLPILVKLSPDLDLEELKVIVNVAQTNNVAGLIATNTTTDRTGLQTHPDKVRACGAGGLSGAPLKGRAIQMIARLYNLTNGSMPLIGGGGIFTAEDAWEMISAGASLIQIYTAFIYEGPSIARKINDGLRPIISNEGFVSLDEAVGSRAKDLAG